MLGTIPGLNTKEPTLSVNSLAWNNDFTTGQTLQEIWVIFKLLIVLLLFIVIFSLGQALFYLIKDEGKSDRMLKALSWRIGLSVFIFILLLIGQAVGLIQPHGLQ
jgi:hypothetical protein